jgi:hypothetical protein
MALSGNGSRALSGHANADLLATMALNLTAYCRHSRRRGSFWIPVPPPRLATQDGDLVVTLSPPYSSHVPDEQVEFVLARLRQFIRDAHLPAPPN